MALDWFGIGVIAEGVEREAQYEFLSRHMCDEVQGYYVSQPIPADAMTDLLRHRLGDRRLPAELRPMGNGTHSRGWLIAVTGSGDSIAPQAPAPASLS